MFFQVADYYQSILQESWDAFCELIKTAPTDPKAICVYVVLAVILVIVIRCFISSDNDSRSGRQTPVPARFRCFGCGRWFKHNRRTKAAWREGYRRMYCDQCHREWLEEHGEEDPDQEYGVRFIDDVELNRTDTDDGYRPNAAGQNIFGSRTNPIKPKQKSDRHKPAQAAETISRPSTKPKAVVNNAPGKGGTTSGNRGDIKTDCAKNGTDYVPNWVFATKTDSGNTGPSENPTSNYGAWRKPDVPVVNADYGPQKTTDPKIIVLKQLDGNSQKLKLRRDRNKETSANNPPNPADAADVPTDLQNNYDANDLEQKRFERGCMLMIGIGVLIFAIVAYFHFFFQRR